MKVVASLLVGLAAGAGVVACGDGDDTYSPAPVTVPDGGGDASKASDATVDAESGPPVPGDGDAEDEDVQPPTLALLRMANWSADAPAVDFCLAPHGTGTFRGPMLGTAAAAINEAGVVDAGSGALSFPHASAYLVVEPAQYDARLVAGGSVDCSTGITPDATNLPALPTGGLQTVALVGTVHPQNGESGLQIVGFVDELKNTLSGALLIRVINAAVDLPKVEVGTLDTYLLPFLAPVAFGASSAGDPMADPNGYISDLPLSNVTIAARTAVPSLLGAPLHTIVAQAPGISLASGATVTFVVIDANGQVPSEGGGGIGALLECIDNAGSVGLDGTCSVISQ
jgi:hypothetical protein